MQDHKLEHMWDQQEKFMQLLREKRGFPAFPVDLNTKSGQQFIDGITYHMMKELFEFGLTLQNAKSHRATEISGFDRDHALEELVDSLHLFFEICIASGFSMQEVYDAYLSKGDVNSRRILNGY